MKNQKFISIFLILILSISLSAQERIILRPNGEKLKLNNSLDLREAIKVSKMKKLNGKIAKHSFQNFDFSVVGKQDTLSYEPLGLFNTDFGFFGQDVMFMWFEAPADLIIKAAGFSCSDDEGAINGADIGLRLIKLNWTAEQLKNFGAATYQGYYPSEGNGYNNSDYFGENATGDWIVGDENNPIPPWAHDNYDLWSDSGRGVPITPELQLEAGNYQWIEMSVLNYEPEVLKGEIFAVVVEHNGENLDEERFGFYSDNTIGYPGWKYYENGRLSSENPGWWIRMYTWDFAVAVDISSCPQLIISNMTILQTTLSTAPRIVTAIITAPNPGGEPSGVVANLIYTINDGTEDTVAMTGDGDLYSGEIPGQQPGTQVTYWIEAIDIDENSGSSFEVTYHIFKVENPNALLVFNGFYSATGYPQSYYFGSGDYPNSYSILEWDHDSWAFGPLTEELIINYKNIIEITTNGPSDINNAVIRDWLNGSGDRNYMLAGDEWLGAQSGWIDRPYLDGTFHFDILGITRDYNDINYAEPGDQELPSVVIPVEGSLLGDSLLQTYNQVSSDSGWTAPMAYDPTYEVGVDNWLDGVDFLADVEIDMLGVGIDGYTYNIGGHRTLSAGNKIVFLSYDPLSLNMFPHEEYWWWGIMFEASQVQALQWFDAIIVGVDGKTTKPVNFNLSQNYPNPFNPTTIIKYTIPYVKTTRRVVFTKLKVYDILGREVATLVNKEQKPGSYEVEFNGKNLSSGVYIYKLQSGNFVNSKKMLLIK